MKLNLIIVVVILSALCIVFWPVHKTEAQPPLPKPQTTLSITTVSCPGFQWGLPYQCQLTATGGVPPYHWSLASGSLPTGLTINDSGLISGTPVPAAPTNLQIQVAKK